MKITRIEAIPVRVPRTQPFKSSLGTHQASENAVVLIHTDEGLTGLGEASSIWDRRGRGESETINDLLAETLIGLDPFRIRDIAKFCARNSNTAFNITLWLRIAILINHVDNPLDAGLQIRSLFFVFSLCRRRIHEEHNSHRKDCYIGFRFFFEFF